MKKASASTESWWTRTNKSAQQRITALEQDVTTLAAALRRMRGDEGPSNVEIAMRHNQDPQHLPQDAMIRFHLLPDGHHYFDVRVDGDTLEIRSYRAMAVLPHVTNVISLRILP